MTGQFWKWEDYIFEMEVAPDAIFHCSGLYARHTGGTSPGFHE